MDLSQAKEEIRARIDIVDLIGSRITLKRNGSAWKACCPFHNEKTPSFVVNQERQQYHCFGCGEHGDIFSFLQKHDGMSFVDAVKMLAEKAGVEITEREDPQGNLRKRLYALHAELAEFYRRCLLQTKEAAIARDYLLSRKLPADICEKFTIGYAVRNPSDAIEQWAKKHKFTMSELEAGGIVLPSKRGTGYYDRFCGRLIFPIRDAQGRVVAFSGRILDPKAHPAKYINSPETPIFTKGNILYAMEKASRFIVKEKNREAILCEGQIDVIRCHACGFESAIASEGTAFTKEQALLLKRSADNAILLYDADNAGRKAAIRSADILLSHEIPVRVASLPDGEDPDSFLRERQPAEFRKLLDAAISITTFQIRSLKANEQNPDSIESVTRIGREVIQLIAKCPSSIMRAKLLNDASAELNMPVCALEEDLQREIADAKNRQHNSERFKEVSAVKKKRAPEPKTPAQHPEPLQNTEVESNLQKLDLQAEAEIEPPPPHDELEAGAFLLEFENDTELLEFAKAYLPCSIFSHRLTRGLAKAILENTSNCSDAVQHFLTGLSGDDKTIIGKLLIQEHKTAFAREFSKEEAAQSFIRKLWINELTRNRNQLFDQDENDDANVNRIFSLSIMIKKIGSAPWDQVAELIGQISTEFS